jgi:hypothetical protein
LLPNPIVSIGFEEWPDGTDKMLGQRGSDDPLPMLLSLHRAEGLSPDPVASPLSIVVTPEEE